MKTQQDKVQTTKKKGKRKWHSDRIVPWMWEKFQEKIGQAELTAQILLLDIQGHCRPLEISYRMISCTMAILPQFFWKPSVKWPIGRWVGLLCMLMWMHHYILVMGGWHELQVCICFWTSKFERRTNSNGDIIKTLFMAVVAVSALQWRTDVLTSEKIRPFFHSL